MALSHNKDPRPGKLFVGGLDERVQKEDLQKFFANAGELEDIWIARKPPGFGFVQFRDPRDADDAIRDLDGKEIMGKVISLQVSDGRARMRARTSKRDRCFHPCGAYASPVFVYVC
jgi:RNA recognition motif-containing protein